MNSARRRSRTTGILLSLLGGFIGAGWVCAESNFGHYFKDGLRYVDGKPVFQRAAYFGYNHWMSDRAEEGECVGPFMAIPFEQVGTPRDFYSTAGFNTGHYSIWVHTWLDGKPYDPTLTREAFRRAAKAGQHVVLTFPVILPNSVTEKYDFHWINEDGEKMPFGHIWGMHHDPDRYAQAVRETYQPILDAVRDEPLLAGYQLGCERWVYDYVRAGKDVSYDDYTLERFREYLRERFTLEAVSERYGRDPAFYSDWSEVFPPISRRPLDFKRRELANFNVARWDWYSFRERHGVKVWVKMIETFQEMDGRGRPFSFEYGHGPFASMGWHPFAEIVAGTTNFSVGNGDFSGDMSGTLLTMLHVKGCGQGPWINNELDAGTGGRYLNAADQRRSLWTTTALGAAGYHIWTFFNLLGAPVEFMDRTYYDPKLYANMPPKYFEALHVNRMLESLGEVLAGSKSPKPRIALMMLDDSLFHYTYTFDYRPEARNLTRAFLTRGLADELVVYTRYHLDHTELEGIEAIVLPRMPRLTDERARKLAAFVERGGTLMIMGPTARFDELFKEHADYPHGPLGEAAGVRMRTLTPDQVRDAAIRMDWRGEAVHLDTQVELVIPDGSRAEAILRDGDGRITATRHPYGRGQVIALSGYPMLTTADDPTGDFLVSLLADAGLDPAVTVESGGEPNRGVFVARRRGPDGTLVFLIDVNDRAHHLDVTLNATRLGLEADRSYSVFECFSHDAHRLSAETGYRFSTQLEPAGVRVFLVTESETLDTVIPPDRRYLVSRTDDEPLVNLKTLEQRSWGRDYLSGTAVQENQSYLRGRTLDARSLGAGAPRPLTDNFVGLDLDPVNNGTLNRMVPTLEDAVFVNYGNVEAAQDSGTALGFTHGVNELGDVPFWSSGGYLGVETRSGIRNIPVGRAVKSLHFFQTAQLGASGAALSTLGYYTVHYEDGSEARVPIVLGVTISDAMRPVRFPVKTTPVTRVKDAKNNTITLSRYDWENPYPDKVVTAVDITGVETGDPRRFNIWAISAGLPPP